jgi:uncharacterized protein (TIGR02118 family)
MIKGFALIPKRPDVSDEKFHTHWRTIHADLALRISALRRYVQSHRIPDAVPGFTVSPYEGAAEIWFENLAVAQSLQDNPDYVEGAFKDEPNFIDVPNLTFLSTQENVVVAGPQLAKDAPGIKGLFLIKRKPGLSVAEFQDYWRNKHAPLVPKTPDLRRYVQCHVCPETYDDENATPAFDGVAELSWPDLATFEQSWASDEIQVEQFDDVKNFVDRDNSVAFLAEENRVIWP